MASGSPAALVAAACFLLGAIACSRGAMARRVGPWLGGAGAVILVGGLAARGLRAGHWPMTSQYEFALAFALGTVLASLALGTGRGPSSVQAASLGVAAALVAYARLGMPAHKRSIQVLAPALDSIWLPLHVGVAALAYGALALAGSAALVWLVGKPSRAEAEPLLDRAIAAGYPLLTLSMVLGMIWAQVAWGRYWGWDLKEVWTLITWLVYTLYWHLRRRPGWQGSRLAWLVLSGFGAIFLTYLGVGWLAPTVGLESLHMF